MSADANGPQQFLLPVIAESLLWVRYAILIEPKEPNNLGSRHNIRYRGAVWHHGNRAVYLQILWNFHF